MSLERPIAGAIKHFRRDLDKKQVGGKSAPARRFVPRLEILEDRELLATFNVTKADDDGTADTLRWAIQQSNMTVGRDTIAFQIPGGAPATITLAAARGALDPITDAVFIDGWSQAQNPVVWTPQIEIDGSALGVVSGLSARRTWGMARRGF